MRGHYPELSGDATVVIHTKNNGEIYEAATGKKREELEDLDVPEKMTRLRQWVADVNGVQSDVTYDFVFVDEASYDKYSPTSFGQLLDNFKRFKEC